MQLAQRLDRLELLVLFVDGMVVAGQTGSSRVAAGESNSVSLGILVELRQTPDQALALAAKAEQLAPSSPEVLDILGWIQYRRGAYTDAEKSLSRAVERATGNGTSCRAQPRGLSFRSGGSHLLASCRVSRARRPLRWA